MSRASLIIVCAVCSLLAAGNIVKPREEVTDIASEFYDLCNTDDTRCIGAWLKSEQENYTACIDDKNCTFAAAVTLLDEGYEFSMLAVEKQYVAVGFSLDAAMGEDAVVACLTNGTAGVINAELSYNVGKETKRAETNEGLKVIESSSEDGLIYCKFTLSDTLTYARTARNDSSDELFYLINVAGQLNEDGTVGHHTGHAYSPEPWSFNSGASLAVSVLLLFIAATFTQF